MLHKHKRIYINIGMKKNDEKITNKNNKIQIISCNKIKCAGQYTVDLINNNIIMDVQE